MMKNPVGIRDFAKLSNDKIMTKEYLQDTKPEKHKGRLWPT